MKSKIQKNISDKEKELSDLLWDKKLFPQRFLVADKDGRIFMYSYSDSKCKRVGYASTRIFGGILRSSKHFCDRGRIMEDILKLEFLISQIIIIKLSDKKIDFFNYKEIRKWNSFIDKITFYQQIEFLYACGLVNGRNRDKLENIRKLRNQAAHSLTDKFLEYKDKIIKNQAQFDVFKNDFENVRVALIKTYNKLWDTEEMIDYTMSLIKTKYAKK